MSEGISFPYFDDTVFPKSKHSIGYIYQINSLLADYYILITILPDYKVCFLNLRTGMAISSPIKVKNRYNITNKEIKKLSNLHNFKFVSCNIEELLHKKL